MGQLVRLAGELLTCHGALVEVTDPGEPTGSAPAALEAVVPGVLAERLGLEEHVHLCDGPARPGARRLVYGGELLERMVQLATESVPVALATLDEPLPRTSDPVAAALNHYTGLNCVLRPSGADPVDGWCGYLVADYRYVADADERREGLVRVTVNEETGADVTPLHRLDIHPSLAPGPGDLLPPADPRGVLRRLRRATRWAAGTAVEPLGRSVRRRHLRDRARLRTYMRGIRTEMEAQLGRMRRRGAGDGELAARRTKIDALEPELERKLADLADRYHLRVNLTPVALLRVGIPVRRVVLEVQRRKAHTTITVHQCAETRGFDPLGCEACGQPVHAFALCDDRLHVLCTDCEKDRPTSRSCPVCGKRGGGKKNQEC